MLAALTAAERSLLHGRGKGVVASRTCVAVSYHDLYPHGINNNSASSSSSAAAAAAVSTSVDAVRSASCSASGSGSRPSSPSDADSKPQGARKGHYETRLSRGVYQALYVDGSSYIQVATLAFVACDCAVMMLASCLRRCASQATIGESISVTSQTRLLLKHFTIGLPITLRYDPGMLIPL